MNDNNLFEQNTGNVQAARCTLESLPGTPELDSISPVLWFRDDESFFHAAQRCAKIINNGSATRCTPGSLSGTSEFCIKGEMGWGEVILDDGWQ